MRRLGAGLAVLAVAAAAVVSMPTVASAKGAVDAMFRGPDVLSEGVAKLDHDQTVQLAMATSLYTPAATRPKPEGDLGPRYVVTYNLMVGPDETVPIRQRLYPFAGGGPIASTRRRSNVGWFDVRYAVFDVLREVGVAIPPALDSSTWPTARDDAHGISISYPPSWRAAPSTLTPVLADPVVPLAVGTATMVPQTLGECDIVPQHAVEAVGRTDALVAIYVYQGMASWSSNLMRPMSFGPDLPWRTGTVQCTEGNRDAQVRTLAFTDGSKRITAFVVIGKDATPQRLAEVYAVLDSLRVD